jgi:hypothetical protein
MFVMPTPFMHMALAEVLLFDPALSPTARSLMTNHWGAFLLGSIAPDARHTSGLRRGQTHFFEYGPEIPVPAVNNFLTAHPELRHDILQNTIQAAFVAGYVAHLEMDQVWCQMMLFPCFVEPPGDPHEKNRLFHILVADLDRQARTHLNEGHFHHLSQTKINHWAPFLPDEAIIHWQQAVADQLAPGAPSRTLEILGKVIGVTGEALGTMLATDLPQVSRYADADHIARTQQAMYVAVRQRMQEYAEDGVILNAL